MRKYYPDNWVRVRITNAKGEQHDRILAGWHGGYVTGDSWKINSGIVEVKQDAEFWEVFGQSGSVYVCHKEKERVSGVTASIFSFYLDSLEAEGGNMEIVLMSDDFM